MGKFRGPQSLSYGEVFKEAFCSVRPCVTNQFIFPNHPLPLRWGRVRVGVDKMKTFWYSLLLKGKIFEAYVFFIMDSLAGCGKSDYF